ncbi:MAG: hypothetical protein R2726_19270 [Acidimicrobiales bacterium]
MPAARINTPTMMTNTASRYGTSSVSYADANHVKFIHAHQMAKNTRRKRQITARWPSPIPWCRPAAAWPTAMTKTRSKNSSSGVEARCGSPASRAAMRTEIFICRCSMGWRRREQAHVQEHGEDVGALPVLHDSPVSHPCLVDATDADRAARRLDAEERTEVGARAVEPERHEVALFDDRDEIDLRVGEPTVHVVQHDADEPVRSSDIAERTVRHQVVVHDGADRRLVVRVDRRDQSLHRCLAGHRRLPACRSRE